MHNSRSTCRSHSEHAHSAGRVSCQAMQGPSNTEQPLDHERTAQSIGHMQLRQGPAALTLLASFVAQQAAHAEDVVDAQLGGAAPTDYLITGLFAVAILALATVTIGVCIPLSSVFVTVEFSVASLSNFCQDNVQHHVRVALE